MPADKIETILDSLVQHGHHNDRIYVMHLQKQGIGDLIDELDAMASQRGYGKIVAKIPATRWEPFKTAGYIVEARVPAFFKGTTDGLFVSKFLSERRRRSELAPPADVRRNPEAHDESSRSPMPPVHACSPAEAGALAALFRRVFKSYAFPIDSPAYLARMMNNDVYYFCCRDDHKIVAAAGIEVDFESRTAEMTDFATLHEHRGRRCAGALLFRLEEVARRHGVITAYTIARADSPAMNRVFQNSGYDYAGRLTRNTQIDGRIRSMIVRYKHLSTAL